MADRWSLLPAGVAIAVAALIGIILGSFIAALVLRWPAGRSVLRGRSSCDHCGMMLDARDLVPLLSALWLRGKCRRCGAVIDPLHWQAEVVGGLIGAAALALMPGAGGWLLALFGWLLLPLVLLDARTMWLPDPLVGFLAIVGLAAGGALLETSLVDRLIGSVAGGFVLAALAAIYERLRGREGMGGGDPKLLAALGAWLGWQALPLMLLMASSGGIVWALAAQGKGDQLLGQRAVPFGVCMGIAAWAAVPIWPLLSGR